MRSDFRYDCICFSVFIHHFDENEFQNEKSSEIGFLFAIRNSTPMELSQHTRIGVQSRMNRLLQFNQRLANSADNARHLEGRRMEFEAEVVKIPARADPPHPNVLFGQNKQWVPPFWLYMFVQFETGGKKSIIPFLSRTKIMSNVGWQRELRINQMHLCAELKRWCVITPVCVREETNNFIKALQRAGHGMGFHIGQPRV